MKKFIRYSVRNSAEVDYDIIIAFLSDWGIDAFEELDEHLIASGIKGAVNEAEIEHYLSTEGISFEKSVVEDQNWNALWESSFEPVLIEDLQPSGQPFINPLPMLPMKSLSLPK